LPIDVGFLFLIGWKQHGKNYLTLFCCF